MEIAVGLMGVGLTTLGLVFAYIWKSNGYLQRQMMLSLEKMMLSLEKIEDGQREIAQMLLNQTKILERIESKV